MSQQNRSPYIAHVFVCTNDRGGARKSCADSNSPVVRAELKERIAARGWKGRIRVSASGCMGLCARGANVMIYPQQIWFSEVSPEDVDDILAAVEHYMNDVERTADP